MHDYTYQLIKIQPITATITIVFLTPLNKLLAYQAGQYIEILYPNGSFQPFSIANAPNQSGEIELHIRHRPADWATQSFLQELQEHQKIILRGAFGKACYRTLPANPIILLAGGTGFAAIKALIEAAIKQNDQRNFHLYWSVKIEEDFYLADLPNHWKKNLKNFCYTPLITQANDQAIRIPEILLIKDKDFSAYQVYASGPFGLVKTAHEFLLQHGLTAGSLYSDML